MYDSGVTLALWDWAEALKAHGHEVSVLHGGGPPFGRPDSFVTSRDGRIEDRVVPHVGGGRATRRPVGLDRFLGPEDVLILHEGWVTTNLVAGEVARRAGIRYLVVPHGVYEPEWRRYLKPPRIVRDAFERRLLDAAAAVHVFFDSEVPLVRSLAPRSRFVVAPTGHRVPDDRWNGGQGYLAWVGRIDPKHKGLDVLVDAVATLPAQQRPTIKIRGYDYKGGMVRLAAKIRAAGVERWVDLGGRISGDEKRRFLLDADGYVLPSRWESQGLALLEALALGLPCLVSDASHVAPTLREWGAAVLARPDPSHLADGLRELAEADAAIGQRARELVATVFSWDRIIPEFVEQLRTCGIA